MILLNDTNPSLPNRIVSTLDREFDPAHEKPLQDQRNENLFVQVFAKQAFPCSHEMSTGNFPDRLRYEVSIRSRPCDSHSCKHPMV